MKARQDLFLDDIVIQKDFDTFIGNPSARDGSVYSALGTLLARVG